MLLLNYYLFCLIITLLSLPCTQSVKARDRKQRRNCRAYRIWKMCTAAVHVDTPYVKVMYSYVILCHTTIPVVIIPVVSVASGSI